ncbi:MAG: hypothetical protein R3D29_05355 [Nitratireductor sp.]
MAIYAMVVLSVAATFIQYRAMRIGIFASIPLCVIFARRVGLASGKLQFRSPAPALAQILVILAMLSPSWFVLGTIVFPKTGAEQVATSAIGDAIAANAETALPHRRNGARSEIHPMCNRAEQYERLAALPTGYVMSDINSGPVIIVDTAHSVVGGPYHRNERAILDMVDFFETDLEKPREIALRREVDYVAWCDPGKPVTPELENNPALAIHLLKGSGPTGWAHFRSRRAVAGVQGPSRPAALRAKSTKTAGCRNDCFASRVIMVTPLAIPHEGLPP